MLPPQKRATRRYPRVQSEHSALIRVLGGQPFEELARTRTLGLGGCMLLSDEPLGNGSLLELVIALDGKVVRTDARVVYEISRPDLRHEVGVEFLRVASGDRLVLESLVARKMAAAAATSPRAYSSL